jgi:hypothetical protein
MEKPGRCDGILVTKDKRETAEKSVGLWGDFPGSGLTRASQAGLRRKKRVGWTKRFDRTRVWDLGKGEGFSREGCRKRSSRERRGKIGRECAG